MAQGQFLGDAAAEGDPDDVGVGQAEGVEEVGGLAGQAGGTERDEPGRGVPGTRGVIGDGLKAAAVQLPRQRRPHFDVAAQTHDEQDRRSFAADRHPQQVSVHPDEGRSVGHHRCTYRPGARSSGGCATSPVSFRAPRVSPERAASHSCHNVHHDPGTWAADSRHSAAVGGSVSDVR